MEAFSNATHCQISEQVFSLVFQYTQQNTAGYQSKCSPWCSSIHNKTLQDIRASVLPGVPVYTTKRCQISEQVFSFLPLVFQYTQQNTAGCQSKCSPWCSSIHNKTLQDVRASVLPGVPVYTTKHCQISEQVFSLVFQYTQQNTARYQSKCSRSFPWCSSIHNKTLQDIRASVLVPSPGVPVYTTKHCRISEQVFSFLPLVFQYTQQNTSYIV